MADLADWIDRLRLRLRLYKLQAPSRSNTLKKKASMRRTGSLKRSSSKRSLAAGSIKGVGGAHAGQGLQ